VAVLRGALGDERAERSGLDLDGARPRTQRRRHLVRGGVIWPGGAREGVRCALELACEHVEALGAVLVCRALPPGV
jgi:hypothetical protein